jgi:DNA-binding transcriptional ArsR family regulator
MGDRAKDRKVPEGKVPDGKAPDRSSRAPLPRREATVREARALAHPLRLRILRLCWQQELTNKQLADRLDRDPGTVLYHVRQLAGAGLLEQAPVRTGDSGALEKPYRAKARSWWLDDPPHTPADAAFAPIEAFQDELRAAGPESVRTFVRFALHLSPEDAAELDRRVYALLDEYIAADDERRDQPAHGGIIVLHQLAG